MALVQSILAALLVLLVGVADTGPSDAPTSPPRGPLTITQGGTYTGNWSSSGSTPTIRVVTTDPVTIVNSTVTNGGSGDVVRAEAGANVTVARSTLNGGNGRAFSAFNIKALTIRNSSINKTSGIRVDRAEASASVTVTRNRARDIQSAGYNTVFTQLADVTTATIDISWNEVINRFGQSGVEDNINLYRSAFAKIHDNYIHGAYPRSLGGSYSGSGIMIDHASHDNEVYANQVVDTTNAGIGIYGGYNNKVHDNRLVFDGQLWTGERLASANVGLMVWNGGREATWANNQAYGNVVGWVHGRGTRSDWWLPDCSGKCANTRLRSVGRMSEFAEYLAWRHKLRANKITIGP